MARPFVPAWYAKLVSAFPLIKLEEAADIHGDRSLRSEPILYVAGGHPRPRRSHEASDKGEEKPNGIGWASRDPECLTWQMMMVFSAVSVRSIQIDQCAPFAESYPGEAFAQVPVLLDRDGTRVLEKDFATWIETRRDEKSAVNGEHETIANRQAIECLLQGPLEAGVLLELVLQPAVDRVDTQRTPVLSAQIEKALGHQKLRRRLNYLKGKQHHSPTNHTPSWSTSMHGIFKGGISAVLGSLLEGGADFETEYSDSYDPKLLAALDVQMIRQEACDALTAIAALSFPSGDERWIGGTSRYVNRTTDMFVRRTAC
jgi:hypothetical protein